MAAVTLTGLRKAFGPVVAVRDVNLAVANGEFVSFLGPSGCGKTTTLNMIAGLETPSAGRIEIGARDVTSVPAMDRNVAMVFQSYALYPHMTVRKNLAFALKVRNMAAPEIARRVEHAAAGLELSPLLDRYPRQLSGGQRQRVALGRALVREPEVFLLDEPLSNLDAVLRVQTRAELKRLFARLGTTAIYVTHDQTEAMTMSDRIAVFRHGVLQQVATPARYPPRAGQPVRRPLRRQPADQRGRRDGRGRDAARTRRRTAALDSGASRPRLAGVAAGGCGTRRWGRPDDRRPHRAFRLLGAAASVARRGDRHRTGGGDRVAADGRDGAGPTRSRTVLPVRP